MAFDQPTRNRLARFVGDARRLVADEFTQQFQSLYGIGSDGKITPPEQLGHLDETQQALAARLRERVDYLIRTHPDEPKPAAAAVERLAREQAFTVLNRLAAVRMAEKRDIIVESVGRGYQARGFQVFSQVAGSGLGEIYARYRRYLFCLFDELAVDLGVLFDRHSPAGMLFPRESALLQLLELLNAPDLESLWTEDETIGWIYQYYNDPAERKKMREQSAAPRNSRELAVRNQFFTPRYVVEFLTDNTLGRLWYEMTKGRTRLKEQCRYLVRRPAEIFLPSPETNFWHDVPGQAALRKFCVSGDPADLPASPELGALFGWLAYLPQIPTPYFDGLHGNALDGLGFAPELSAVGIDPHALAESWRRFLAGETSGTEPAQAQTIELLHLLWLIPAQRASRGDHDWATIDPVETLPAAALLWRTLRDRLQNPPSDLSQELLLRQPVLIPHRPAKDPREIRLLDPACGSMHFGLYAFDLFETIYAEAWDLGLIAAEAFGGDIPPFPHGSVRVDRLQETVLSNDSHRPVLAATARIVMPTGADGGDGMHTGPFVADDKSKFRVGIRWEMPWMEFDYAVALAAGRFTPEEGERLVRETPGAWLHDRIDPLPAEEIMAAFRRDVPRLILEHNIHGIDIDPRAVQIAGLSLWLRAQRAWREMGLRPVERPQVRRANVVCAEPMPGEQELLREFTSRLRPAALGGFVERVFDRMRLAGEAGALLKIEEEITAAVSEAKARWQSGPTEKQGEMFAKSAPAQVVQGELPIDVSGISDGRFFEQAEAQIYEALRAYAEEAEGGGNSYLRRLFAEDAARGFAFIDLCRQNYDVVVMNPPFGDASQPSKSYIDETYGDTRGDVYKAFVECFQARLIPAGYLGIISSRTGFFLSQSEDWRTRVVLRLFRPIVLADLGMGVLDAMVEVAAYVLRSLSASEARSLTLSLVPVLNDLVLDRLERFSLSKWQAARDLKRHQAVGELAHLETNGFIQRSSGDAVRYTPLWHSVKNIIASPAPIFPPLVCIRALSEQDKGAALSSAIHNSSDPRKFISDPSQFARLPGSTFSYWARPQLVDAFENLPKLADAGFEAWVGLQTNQDFRWLRLWWEINEVASSELNHQNDERCWLPFAKGGEFAPVYCDVPLVVFWGQDGRLIKIWKKEQFRQGFITENNSQCWNETQYKRPGLTWPRRTNGLSFRVMPAGCIFGDKGPAVLSVRNDKDDLLSILALLNSAVFLQMVGLMLARVSLAQSFEVGIVRAVPIPEFKPSIRRHLHGSISQIYRILRMNDATNSTSHAFVAPCIITSSGDTLTDRVAAWDAHIHKSKDTIATIQAGIDELAFRLYGLDIADHSIATSLIVEAAESSDTDDAEDEKSETDSSERVTDLLAYFYGCALGRWDLRFATGERHAPPVPDPFAPLPVCPPGMLQDADTGLPVCETPPGYPLRISWSGILVDDPGHPEDIEGRVREVLEILWPAGADAIEQEAVGLLGVKSLRDYFRRPGGFFADHLKRYSKSRRQAPIYWPLSTASGSYTLWIYYHRLTDQTLHAAIADFLDPKLKALERDITTRRESAALPGPGNAAATRLGELVELRDEIAALRAELERIIALPWRPNLNDGVLITASPLWRLFRLGKWQKDLKACWDSLSTGEYDWAHLVYSIWSDRVREKCRTDRSLAIAHNLEELCTVEPPKPKAKRTKKQPSTT